MFINHALQLQLCYPCKETEKNEIINQDQFLVVGLYKSRQCKNTLLQNRVADLETIPSFLAAWLVNLLKIWMARILSK